MGRSLAKERDTNYISPKQFSQELAEYYAAAEEVDKLEEGDNSPEAKKKRRICKKALDKCGVALYKIAIGLSNNGKFSGYTWKDEMICDALSKRNRALIGRKFDFSKACNPFSYFNRIFWREFVRRIKLEKKHLETKQQYSQEHYRDFAEDSDIPIYVKKLWNIDEEIGEFWDDEEATHSKELD